MQRSSCHHVTTAEQHQWVCELLSHYWFGAATSGLRWITFIPDTVWTSVCDPGRQLPAQLSPHSERREWNKGELGINQVTKGDEDDDTAAAPACTLFSACVEQKAPHNLNSTAASRFLCQPQGLFTLEHAQFGSFPCNNSQWERSHTLTHSTPAPQWERDGEERLPAVLRSLLHAPSGKHTLPFVTKVSTQTCRCYCENLALSF